ncbi:MAG: helix-turn-helix domain-containing protein [Gemmatimonadota bacterium]
MSRHVRRVLDRASGKEAQAAKLLGITKKELKERLQRGEAG